ncbi:MAG: segregation/condensation protein A, partial [Butyrivibrio sp.]|nr:segregation/condensation protein A [Butyrivibrio sp.]
QKRIPKEVSDYEAPVDISELIGDATLTKLNEIFQDLLKRQEDKVDPIRSKFGNIEKEEVDMDAKTLYIKAYIREHSRFSFRQLLEKQHNKTEIIVTFLVMLEEMKLGEIEIEQETTFGDIIITSRKVS